MPRRKETLKSRFEKYVIPEPNTGCWLWTGFSGHCGYGRINIARKSKLAHRVSYELYKQKIPDGLCALHKCDTPACVNPNHIFIGTKADNIADMVKKGRARNIIYRKGEEAFAGAKLTWKIVRRIRNIYKEENISQAALAKRFKISQSMVCFIITNRNWIDNV